MSILNANFRFKLDDDDNNENIPVINDNEILLIPNIWNSYSKDDNQNFHQKYTELINKEKFKKLVFIINPVK